MTLDNKVALITGAGSGIGRAIALLYAREGAKLMLTDLDETGGDAVVEEIKAAGGDAIFIKADAGRAVDHKNAVEQTLERFGALHIAVNNAGIGGPHAPVADYPIAAWNNIISVNLSGVFYGMHYQIPAMLASGGGSIVNVGSILSKAATKNAAGYVAAKHGVIGLTKAASLEYATQNIRVNTIGPGYITTPLLDQLDEATRNGLVGLHPMGRLGTAEEVAELALWLNSDKASFVTGSYYNVDGGYLAQ